MLFDPSAAASVCSRGLSHRMLITNSFMEVKIIIIVIIAIMVEIVKIKTKSKIYHISTAGAACFQAAEDRYSA